MSDLPKGWIEVPISEFATTQSGGTPSTSKKEYWENGTVPWLNSGGLKDSIVKKPSKYITELGLASSSARLFPRKTVLIALTGATTGETGLLDFDCSTNQSVTGIFPSEAYIPEYLFFYLQSARKKILENALGSAQPHINKRIVDETIIPLAPFNEQKRIVEKLEKVLSRIESIQARLDKIPAILKRFRQGILTAACSGKLTAKWREENPNVESAAKLVNNILEARYLKWVKSQKNENIDSDSTQKKERLAKKYKEPALPFSEDLPELPPMWHWATTEQLAILITDGDHNPPKRVPEGIPHLTAKNIKNGKISLQNCTFISAEDFQKVRKRYEPMEGDVIITCVGTIGQIAIVPSNLQFSADRNLAAIRLLKGYLPQILANVLNLPYYQEKMKNSSGSSAQPHLYLGDLRSITIPVMPIEEQKEIIRRVEDLFKFADQIEERYKKARSYTDKLTQSILAKAFCGELVPQNETDESAFGLLQRIKLTQAELKNEVKVKKPSMTRKTSKKAKSDTILDIDEALKLAGRELSSKDLLVAAGYNDDAEPEEVEKFFIAIRDAIVNNRIAKTRSKDEDWFSLVNVQTK